VRPAIGGKAESFLRKTPSATIDALKALRALAFAALAGCAASGGTVSPGVRYEAILTRDRYGVPHLTGRSPGDVGYALGHAQCEDRAGDVVRALSEGSGRLAELFGPDELEVDRRARELLHRPRAEEDWPKLPLAVQELVRGYVEGVNDWIAEHPRAFAHPVRRFEPLDVVAWHRHLLAEPLLEAARRDAEGAPAPGPSGSNAWAVSGGRSSTGRPLLLIDPAGPFDGPRALYEAHLRAGELDVWGFFPIGVPLPAAGANAKVAWTYVEGGADAADAYALRLNPADPDEYEWEGKFVRMELRRESIRVREPAGLKDVELRLRSSRHGPVLLDGRGRAFAAWLGGGGHARALEQAWRMSTSRGAAELKAALALDLISGRDFVWAAEGSIGFVRAGQVPERAGGQDWDKPVPGWTALTLPAGHVPYARLARVEDPASGFLQACESPADKVTPGLLAWSPADFPAGALGSRLPSPRARRALDLLRDAPRVDLEAARRIAFDTYSAPAEAWIPVILAAARDVPELAEAVELLRGWSRHADEGSAGATLFRFWRLACAETAGGRAGRDAEAVSDTPEIRAEALAALRRTVETLKRVYGRVAVPWGEVKRLRRGTSEWGLSGDGPERLGLDTLRSAGGAALEGGKIWTSRGQGTTALVFLGAEAPVIHAVRAGGQSADPESPHFADQAPLYARREPRPLPWSSAEIVARTSAERALSGPR
jgi:acyl-homoserine-lactone acylase